MDIETKEANNHIHGTPLFPDLKRPSQPIHMIQYLSDQEFKLGVQSQASDSSQEWKTVVLAAVLQFTLLSSLSRLGPRGQREFHGQLRRSQQQSTAGDLLVHHF